MVETQQCWEPQRGRVGLAWGGGYLLRDPSVSPVLSQGSQSHGSYFLNSHPT